MTDVDAIIALRSALLADSPTHEQQLERLVATVFAWVRSRPDPASAIEDFTRTLRLVWSAR